MNVGLTVGPEGDRVGLTGVEVFVGIEELRTGVVVGILMTGVDDGELMTEDVGELSEYTHDCWKLHILFASHVADGLQQSVDWPHPHSV